MFLIWGDDAGKLFYLSLPARVVNRAFKKQDKKRECGKYYQEFTSLIFLPIFAILFLSSTG